MVTIEFNKKFVLSSEKASILRNDLNLHFDSCMVVKNMGVDVTDNVMSMMPITSDQLYDILPWQLYLDNEPCSIVVFNEITETEALYVVAYQSNATGEVYESFSANTLVDALYDAVIYCYNNSFLEEQYLKKCENSANENEIESIIVSNSNSVSSNSDFISTVTERPVNTTYTTSTF